MSAKLKETKPAMIATYGSLKAIETAIQNMHTTGQALQIEMHKVALSVLQHVGKHGDIRIVAKMLLAMPENSRVNDLRTWFEFFGPVAFVDNLPVYVKGKSTLFGDAMGKPFWKFSPEKPYTPLDVKAALSSLIKRMQNDQTKTGTNHGAALTQLEALSATYTDAPVVDQSTSEVSFQ